MTSKERFLAALRRETPERVPVFLRDLTLGLDVLDLSTPEVCAGGPGGIYHAGKSAAAVVACQRRFGHDCVVGSIQDLGLDAEALGGRTEFPERGIPRVVAPPFADKSRLVSANIPRMDRDGRLPGILASYALVKQQIGGTVAIAANIEGPITKAGILRGLQPLLFDFTDDPAFARDLVAFATDVSIAHARHLVQAGADIVFLAAASDGPAVVSPDLYLEYTIPHLHRLVTAGHDAGVPVVFHPHGRFTDERHWPLVEAAIAAGIDGFQISEGCDLRLAKAKWGDRIAILGGIDLPTVLVPGPVERIRTETETCLREGAPGGGYVFMPSCSLHRGTPFAHLDAMLETVRSWRPGQA